MVIGCSALEDVSRGSLDEVGALRRCLDGTAPPPATSYVDVGGRRVERADDARWCLDWLDRFDDLVRRYGRYREAEHRREVLSTIDRARDFYRSVLGRALDAEDR